MFSWLADKLIVDNMTRWLQPFDGIGKAEGAAP
jgi:hypothetical protein